MSAAERDFSTFHLGDNVYELAGGVIPDIARELNVRLADEPNSDDIQAILNVLGRQEKELRENPDVLIGDRDKTADLIDRAGTQKSLSRSLWTPDVEVTFGTVDAKIALGAVANWTDRITAELVTPPSLPIYLIGGNRVMSLGTEVTNPNVIDYKTTYGRLPKESNYLASVALPELVEYGENVAFEAYRTGNADEILAQFFDEYPELLNKRLSLVRTANAGVIMALQVRAVARTLNPDFDSDKNNPQMFVQTDEIDVSRTEEDDNDPVSWQKGATGIKQVPLVAKKLVEATL